MHVFLLEVTGKSQGLAPSDVPSEWAQNSDENVLKGVVNLTFSLGKGSRERICTKGGFEIRGFFSDGGIDRRPCRGRRFPVVRRHLRRGDGGRRPRRVVLLGSVEVGLFPGRQLRRLRL